MSPGRRSFSRPRSDGTMQKVQVLLQPTEIDTHAEYGDWRRAGSRRREGGEGLLELGLRLLPLPGPLEQAGQRADVVRAVDDVHPGGTLG